MYFCAKANCWYQNGGTKHMLPIAKDFSKMIIFIDFEFCFIKSLFVLALENTFCVTSSTYHFFLSAAHSKSSVSLFLKADVVFFIFHIIFWMPFSTQIWLWYFSSTLTVVCTLVHARCSSLDRKRATSVVSSLDSTYLTQAKESLQNYVLFTDSYWFSLFDFFDLFNL